MTFATHYNVGTVTVAGGSTAVTGVNTLWQGNVRKGDYLWVDGLSCRVDEVNSNTSLTLARPWPGANAAGVYYEALAVLDAVGYQRKLGQLLEKLASGNLDAFAGLLAAADTLPYFNGSGSMALAPLKAFGRSFLGVVDVGGAWTALGSVPDDKIPTIPESKLPTIPESKLPTIPVSKLPNIPASKIPDLAPDKAFRRGNILGSVSQASGVPTGELIERGSNGNGEYVKFADGTQICTRTFSTNGITPTARNEGSITGGAFYDNLWTYAAAFVGSPSVESNKIVATSGGTVRVFSGSSFLSNNQTNANLRFWSVSTFDAVISSDIAIGRWF